MTAKKIALGCLGTFFGIFAWGAFGDRYFHTPTHENILLIVIFGIIIIVGFAAAFIWIGEEL